MGVVYEAWDKDRNARVALKTFSGLDPRSLHLFKNEFRSLADVTHHNLAAFYELFSEEGQWFFSMEYVEGGHFLESVRPVSHSPHALNPDALSPDDPTIGVEELASDVALNVSHPQEHELLPARCDTARLVTILRQLTQAVMALHSVRILHRDLKPLNVKVTPEDRVVVLDFGLAAHAGVAQFEPTGGDAVVGTIPYMSPEQAAGSHVTEATDWYAVGVMTFEALTGRRPFEGAALRVLTDKQRFDAPLVSSLANVPEEWSAICEGLLERDPRRRMQGPQLLAVLDRQSPRSVSFGAQTKLGERIFVGRETHLAVLREAWHTTERNVPSLVFVHGNSGIGKSSLIEHFLAGIAGNAQCVTLSGRCYERESMPYKAFDGVVDAVASYMSALPRHEAMELIPREVAALAQVFPVLREVKAIADAPQRSTLVLDQHELRRKAFAALRELLARLGDRRRVVIYIDDLQWGDVDSAVLFREIIQPPDAPAFLFICAYRSEYQGRTPALDSWLSGIPTGSDEEGSRLQRRDVLVGPLNRDETRKLALRLLSENARDAADPVGQIEDIARESEGSPYLLQEIAARLESGSHEPTGVPGAISLDDVLYRRIGALAKEPRQLLETISVSSRPLAEREAFRAAQLDAQDPRVLVALRAARLVRGSGGGGEIEPYHDRVREAAVAHMSAAALRQCHLRLGALLEASVQSGKSSDAEAAALHLEAGGEKEKASAYYAAAAERASAALAFKHAASLCQRALDLSPATGEERRLMVVRLADALANAGRGAEAADAYREAGRGASEPEISELERKEAYWFAASGHVDEGREALLKILRRAKVRLPRRWEQMVGLVFTALWFRFRGIGYRERQAAEISAEELNRADVYWDAIRGFFMLDPPTAMYLTGRGLSAAFRRGETQGIARVLTFYCVASAGILKPSERSLPAEKMLSVAAELMQRTNTPYLLGLYGMAAGMVAFLGGRWLESLGHFEQAERILSQQCTGVAWELASTRVFYLWDCLYAGRFLELSRRAPALSQDGAERGDLYQTVSVETGHRPFCKLIAGRPDAALQILDEGLDHWTRRHNNIQFGVSVYVRSWIFLYQQRAVAAWDFLERDWPDIEKNQFLRLSGTRQWLYSARAQSALALSLSASNPNALLSSALRDARKLDRDEAPFAHVLADLIRAGCASRRGDAPGAMVLLEKSIAGFEASNMAMMAAVSRRRLGEITGSEQGRRLMEAADAAMTAEGVHDPARFCNIFANGFGVA